MDAQRATIARASLVEDNGSPTTSSPINIGGRIGEVKRVTKETNVLVRINLDGSGVADSSTENVAYGMYPLQVMNPDGVFPGSTVPSVLMLYNMVCSPAQQLEFGVFGTVQLIESSSKSINVQQNIQIDSAQSSPDKPVRQAH